MNARMGMLHIICFTASVLEAAVTSSDGGAAWLEREAVIVEPADKADAVNAYGGFVNRKVEGSGFFRTLKRKNHWWLVDPDGHPFIMKGLNSVEAKRVGHTDSPKWAEETYALLRDAGFNTIGRWSEHDAFQEAGVPVPWCSTSSFMSYAKHRPEKNGERGCPNSTIPVFDPEWPEYCERYAEKVTASCRTDKWLIGYFSDNELPFRPDALTRYLALPEDDLGHKAARAWLSKNRVKQADIQDPAVQQEFLEEAARRYYIAVARALKKADPNHLYLGSRLHGRCINPATITAAGVCDVISVNYYHRWKPEEERLANWEKWSGRPFFVSEFYAMKVPDQVSAAKGSGFRVLNSEDAAAFYHTHTATLLKDVPSCVGWHWFKYADDNPEGQKGIISADGKVHRVLLGGMKVINEQVYTLRGLR